MPDANPPIIKRQEREIPSSFEALKREGLGLAQQFSGATWTDYNLHDPGVTILEQLCYALTDLIYRTNFPIEDLLTSISGAIDYPNMGLYSPEEIYPSRPLTLSDYRKTLLDAIPDIDNVWFHPLPSPSPQGLHQIIVKVGQHVGPHDRESIVTRVHRTYARHRNLCEDVQDIVVLQPIDCEVEARIEISGERDPDHVAADVYEAASRLFAGGVTSQTYQEAWNRGEPLEQILEGPLTQHGLFEVNHENQDVTDLPLDAHHLAHLKDTLEVFSIKLFGILKGITGILSIRSLAIHPDSTMLAQLTAAQSVLATLQLRLPEGPDNVRVSLLKNGRTMSVSLPRILARFEERQFARRAIRRTPQDLSTQHPLPQGTFRDVQRYSTIQDHFPAVYGITQFGVPESAPPDVHARAMQLRTYLLLFEQCLANFTMNLHQFPKFFSLDTSSSRSYWYQVLDDRCIPGISRAYREPPEELLRRVFHEDFDAYKFLDRKNRVFDRLLALYGEKFSQYSLRQFNVYYSSHELDQVILANKAALLKAIADISQHRAGGFDYGEEAWNTDNVAWLKKKASLLLGVKFIHSRSLTDVFIEQGLEVVPDVQFPRIKEGTVELPYIDLDDIRARINAPFETPPTLPPSGRSIRQLSEDILFLQNHVVSDSILRNGIDPARYRVGSTGDTKAFQVAFRPTEVDRWLYLGSCPTQEEAIRAANDLRGLLITLNIDSEGFHVVEHLLLRPEGQPLAEEPPGGFYASRISVVFPSWTARFHNPEFRNLAEETIRLNCPAHVQPTFLWLDFGPMRDFEFKYKAWLEAKRAPDPSPEGRNAAAERLVTFLRRMTKTADLHG